MNAPTILFQETFCPLLELLRGSLFGLEQDSARRDRKAEPPAEGDANDEQRTEQFFPDPRLPGGSRAELSDFARSGLDRDHLAPAGDQPDGESMAQSFAPSNIVPQSPTHNRKIWSKAERDVPALASWDAAVKCVFEPPRQKESHPSSRVHRGRTLSRAGARCPGPRRSFRRTNHLR